jgi:predicted HicB family RNase H-like nuclease
MLTYKGYTGHVELDAEAGLFHGEVLDTRDVITFQGTSIEELTQAFHDSIDEYLEFCKQRGEEPDKPFSGRLMLRVPPPLHRRVYAQAKKEGKSLNQWILDKLKEAS